MPIKIFSSYSSADEQFRQELENHLAVLKRAGLIETWNFRQIEAGDEWKRAIDERLNDAEIILLLVSSDFLGSDYCWEVEMKRALERHDRGEAIVIPIVVRDCDWHSAPFAKLQALPEGAKPVARWRPRDRAWASVVAGIRQKVQSIKAKAASGPRATAPATAVGSTAPPPVIATAPTTSMEPGRWFHLVDNSYSAGELRFGVRNEGAPFICLEFRSLTSGCKVKSWGPSTVPKGEIFRAPTSVEGAEPRQCEFELVIRDSRGNKRTFHFELDRSYSPSRLDFRETTS